MGCAPLPSHQIKDHTRCYWVTTLKLTFFNTTNLLDEINQGHVCLYFGFYDVNIEGECQEIIMSTCFGKGRQTPQLRLRKEPNLNCACQRTLIANAESL